MSSFTIAPIRELPEQLYTEIFYYLSFDDLKIAFLFSQAFNKYASSDLIWAPKTKEQFSHRLTLYPKIEKATWKKLFGIFYQWKAYTIKASSGEYSFNLLSKVVKELREIT